MKNYLLNPTKNAAKVPQNAGGGTSQSCALRSEGAQSCALRSEGAQSCVLQSEGARYNVLRSEGTQKERSGRTMYKAQKGNTHGAELFGHHGAFIPDGHPTADRQSCMPPVGDPRGVKRQNDHELPLTCLLLASYLPLTYTSFDTRSSVSRQSDWATRVWKYAACVVMLLVLSIGQMWGTEKTYTVQNPAASKRYVQDNIMMTGTTSTSKKIANSSQNVFYLQNGNYAPTCVISKVANIKKVVIYGNRDTGSNSQGTAFNLQASTNAIDFSVPTSGFTATKQDNGDPAELGSLSAINMIGNNQSYATTITVTFTSPVMAIRLVGTASVSIKSIAVTYDDAITVDPELCEVHMTSTTAAALTGTGTWTATNIQSGNNYTDASSNTYYYDKSSGTYGKIDLGAGNTFQEGDEIWFEMNGNGLRAPGACGYRLNSSNSTSGAVTIQPTCSIAANMPMFMHYVTKSTDPWVGQQVLWILRYDSNDRLYQVTIHRAAGGGATSHSVSAVTSTGTNTYGTVSAAASSVAEGGTTTITAVPASGYRVTNWAVSGTGASISPTGASNSTTTTLTMGTANATVTVTFGAIPTHTITYTNTKGMDNSANPTSYYEGVGVASFTKLRHAEGYDFTGWSPSSISSSATTDQTIDAQWTARAAATGTGTLTYALAFESSIITTSSITRNNGALYDATNISTANTSFVSGGEAPGNGCSGKLATTSSKSESNYVELTFKIADGYTFTPSGVSIRANAVSNNKTLEVELKDNAASPHTKSVTATLAAGSTSGGVTYNLDFSSSPVTLEGTVTLKIYVYGSDGATKGWRIGPSVIVNGTVASAAPSCTAPSSVAISGEWRYFPGQTIDLTATPTGHTGTPQYQWQKEISTNNWQNVSNGTEAGVTISGATTNNLQITPCGTGNTGKYRCSVSTGATCSCTSDSYDVKIFSLNGAYDDGEFSSNDITFTSGTAGTATVHLAAGRVYKFKVTDNFGMWFGNSGKILEPASNWTFPSNNNDNCVLFTGPEGDYTFTVDIDHVTYGTPEVVVSVAYPDVTHPSTGYAYFKDQGWTNVGLHMWYNGGGAYSEWGSDPWVTKTTEICGATYYYTPLIPSWYNRAIFHEVSGSGQTGDITITNLATYSGKYNDNSDAEFHDFTTYRITYVAGGGSGSMSATSGICPNSNQTITSNAFTAPSGCASFAHWTANVDVKVGDATITAGNPIANGATIQDINSDITLTAVWKLAAPTITDNGDNTFSISGSMTGSSYYYTTNGSTPTTSSSLYSSAVDFSAGEADITAKAIAHKDGYVDSDVASHACTYHAPAASLTAISADVLYQAANMANITFTGSDQNFTGLSTNNLFKVYGTDGNAAKGKNENHNVTDDISTKSFTSALYILSNSNTTSTSDPTQGAIEIITPSTAGLLYLYLDANNSSLTLKKQGTSTSTSLSGATYKAMEVDANTHYFINGSSSGKRGLYGIQYVSTYAVTITPTNVTKATGDATAVKGKAYTATFTANTGYTLPSDVTVTIGGAAQTKGTGYTWEISDGTGTLTVPGAKVTGAIVVTVSGVAPSGHIVTYNYNGATSGASPASATGASVTLPTPTRTGYELDGWYTTDGTRINDGGKTYNPTADITLYARWEEECDAEGVAKSTTDVAATGYTTYQEKGGSNVVFTSAPSLGFKYKDADGKTINSSTTAVVRNNAYSCKIQSSSSNKGSIKTNSTFSNVDSISFYFAASDKGGCKIAVWYSTDNFSTDSTSLLSATTYADNNSEFKLKTLAIPLGKKASALTFKFRFTVTGAGKTCYMDSLKVYSSTTGGSTCYHVYYHGNGAESGYVNDTVSYTAGSKATVLNYNYGRYPLAKAGYDFRGWATSASGAVAYSAGQKIDITSADVDLYAVWATASTALVTWEKKVNVTTWTDNTTPSTTEPTNIGTIGSSATLIASPGATSGKTPQIQLASGASNADKGASFTFSMKSADKVVVPTKVSCEVANVGSESNGDITYKAVLTDGAGNTYYSTNSICPTNNGTLNPIDFVFSSGLSLRGDITVKVYAWLSGSGSGFSFRMGPDVKFYGTVEDYACATPAAPTISGVSEYVPGQTITLTASHDGENHDNLTTYTWYKGVDWATASGTTPVQAAATGEDGYIFTKATCAAGDAGKYWCKVSNGTGCDAHNSEGYNIIVYPTYTIEYNLNGGAWGEVEHKDSYTQFDEDYTLPVPTKADAIFAGWYEASDFSGLPTVVLGAGSVGDKEYWAKWATDYTISWTDPASDPKLGGGGYTVTGKVATWTGTLTTSMISTTTSGVTITNVTVDNSASPKTITATFNVGASVEGDAVTFVLDVPAAGIYGAKSDSHDVDIDRCTGSAKEIRFLSANKNDAGSNFADMSTSSNTTQYVGSGIAKLIATGSCGLNDADKKIGYRSDRLNVVFKLTATTALDIYFNAGSTGKTLTLYSFSSDKALSDIGTSDYSSRTTVTSGVSVTGAAFASSSHTTTSGTASLSSGVVSITAQGGVKISYSSLAAGYYVLTGSSDGYLYGFDASGGSGSSSITPTLTWDDGDDDIATTGIAINTSDDDFTYEAVQNQNSLGAITYSSSNTSVATVNATTGKVHIVGAAGNATITATIAASGCYNSANVSYTITVTDNCDDEAGTIETVDLGCSGIQMTITGHTAAAGVSYQWYKDGVSLGSADGAQTATYTATAAGEYYVIVTNSGDRHCAKRSTNTIVLEAKAAATATKIVDEWYVKNGRRTPDVELVQTTNAVNFTVANGSSTVIWNSASGSEVTTGFGGCGFRLGDNGIIYLNGTTEADGSGNAASGLTAGDETLTITVYGCDNDVSQSITIHKQAATDYKSIAFVVDGTKGGAWDAVTSGHADGTELYEYLDSVGTAAGKRQFQLTERNIYSTTDEKAIRQHYSQFDAILITDDPSTNTVAKSGDDYKTKGYVNAFGTMVDVRPILTMEAFVSALANWKTKGIAGTPDSPNPRQYAIRLECKDHEIYGNGLPEAEDGTNVWEEVIGDETYRYVIMVDSTKGVYNGVAYNVETAGNKKPALQGFDGTASGSLLGLGRISNGSLQAAIERQEEPAARLLVFGINALALRPTSALTDEGKQVIANILTYLLKTNMEEVDDCSNYFTGKTNSLWSEPSNWSKTQLPSSEAKVRILAPCVISGIQPHVLQVSIVNSGNSNIRNTARGSAVCDGKLTIEPDGALIADGKIRSAVAPHFAANDLMPTTPEMLTINTNGSGQAALIFNNEEGLTKAKVNLYSLGRNDGSYKYQYFAIPMEYLDVSPTFANETHGGTKIYTYVYEEASSGWTRRGYYDGLYAFEGLGITTKSATAMEYTMTGTLASTTTKEITLTHDDAGLNLIGNSWMAPIQIGALAEDNTDANITKTVYIYCAGRDAEGGALSGDTETAGQWLAVPFEAASFATWIETGKLSVIPAMQAFQIKTATEATLTLDYNKVVRGSTNDLNAKLRAPRRREDAQEDEVTLSILRVADSKTHTDISLFEGGRFSDEFDNGWEAEYINSDGRSAQFYAMGVNGKMAVLATNELEGTKVGFEPGQEREYTIRVMGSGISYYLNDLKEKKSMLISEGNTYSFTYEEGDEANRFLISGTPFEAPQTPTGVGQAPSDQVQGTKVQKVIYQDKVYIIRGGKIYDIVGKVVK